MQSFKVRRLIISLCVIAGFCLIPQVWGAPETFSLTTGKTMVGELLPSSANDAGIQIKIEEGKYERVPWPSFSQEDLKKMAQNKKLQPFVEPFIEITQEEKVKKTEVPVQEPSRLARPGKGSFFGALFSSGPGLLILVLTYAAGIFAGYEVAIFRGQSVPLVCGLSAIPFLGWLAPIIFVSIPTHIKPAAETWDIQPPAGAPLEGAAATAAEAVNPMQGDPTGSGSGLRIAHTPDAPVQKTGTETVTFQRGQFTFNRRFFETKFAGFFSAVRRDPEKDMVIIIKAARGDYVGQRIARIATNDLHLEVVQGGASKEVMIPFQEIKEIQLKHKDAA
jgi:hypothetical protein